MHSHERNTHTRLANDDDDGDDDEALKFPKESQGR